jgi:hypothetical protein
MRFDSRDGVVESRDGTFTRGDRIRTRVLTNKDFVVTQNKRIGHN